MLHAGCLMIGSLFRHFIENAIHLIRCIYYIQLGVGMWLVYCICLPNLEKYVTIPDVTNKWHLGHRCRHTQLGQLFFFLLRHNPVKEIIVTLDFARFLMHIFHHCFFLEKSILILKKYEIFSNYFENNLNPNNFMFTN